MEAGDRFKTRTVGFNLDDSLEVSTEQAIDQEEEKEDSEILKQFISPLAEMDEFQEVESTNLEIIEKKVLAFATQYGPRNQNTTKMLFTYLETLKTMAQDKLMKSEYSASAYLFLKALSFSEPYDPDYKIKFLQAKVTITNKLMNLMLNIHRNSKNNSTCSEGLSSGYGRFAHASSSFFQNKKNNLEALLCHKKGQAGELQRSAEPSNKKKSILQIGFSFIQTYIRKLRERNSQESLRQLCLKTEPGVVFGLETNFYYAGKFSSKLDQNALCIQHYTDSLQLLKIKMEKGLPCPTNGLTSMKSVRNTFLTFNNEVMLKLRRLQVRLLYKLSKAYRSHNEYQQMEYERKVKEMEEEYKELQPEYTRKIREFAEEKKFKIVLSGLNSRKNIENEVMRLIEEAKNNNMPSLYDYYASDHQKLK